MDHSIIFTKTAKSVLELKNGARAIPAPLLNVLRRVDGRSSVDVLVAGMDGRMQQQTEEALALLEEQKLIRVYARDATAPEPQHAAEPAEPAPMYVTELDPEQAVLAWAEARRGARALTQLGFFATGHSDEYAAGSERTVLIVEDDEAIATLMKSYLVRRGFGVTVVGDGQQALQALDQRPLPRIVLLDVNLPGINGFDLLTYIRAHADLQALPAVMVAAQVSDGDVLRGLKGGTAGYRQAVRVVGAVRLHQARAQAGRLSDTCGGATSPCGRLRRVPCFAIHKVHACRPMCFISHIGPITFNQRIGEGHHGGMAIQIFDCSCGWDF